MLTLWLIVPLLVGLVAAGLVSTVLSWWLGHVDSSLSTGLRWALVLVAIVISARVGGARLVDFAGKAFSAASVGAAPADRSGPHP